MKETFTTDTLEILPDKLPWSSSLITERHLVDREPSNHSQLSLQKSQSEAAFKAETVSSQGFPGGSAGKIPWRRKWQPILACKVPRAEEPGGLQSMGSQGAGHNGAHTRTGLWGGP